LDKRSVTLRFLTDLVRSLCVLSERNNSPVKRTARLAWPLSFGARSAWHTHPAGQVLIVTAGAGWIQEEGQKKREIKQGDVVWTPPGVKHWHGATSNEDMSHIAITNMLGGKHVDWMERVSDEKYRQ
jgi:quercetin dioxygenase-like cupin family protein